MIFIHLCTIRIQLCVSLSINKCHLLQITRRCQRWLIQSDTYTFMYILLNILYFKHKYSYTRNLDHFRLSIQTSRDYTLYVLPAGVFENTTGAYYYFPVPAWTNRFLKPYDTAAGFLAIIYIISLYLL